MTRDNLPPDPQAAALGFALFRAMQIHWCGPLHVSVRHGLTHGGILSEK